MQRLRWTLSVLLTIALLGFFSSTASATGGGGGQPLDLNILVVNDDGYDADGITALRDALIAAGHSVTVVAPATNQSGKGGSANTNVFDFTPGVGLMQLVNYGGNVWSLAGTPADSAKAALDIVMKNNPPDLVVSGLNEGQNIGKPGTIGSGTEGAALNGVWRDIPAIAGSVEVLFSEGSSGFPSTVASYSQAADFMVRLIDRLTSKHGSKILPHGVEMLNVNFPVPYADIVGVRTSVLADGSDIELPLFDPNEGFPAFGIPGIPSFPNCGEVAANPGTACFAGVGVGFSADEGPITDLGALRDDYITITPYNADMTGGFWPALFSLHGLQP